MSVLRLLEDEVKGSGYDSQAENGLHPRIHTPPPKGATQRLKEFLIFYGGASLQCNRGKKPGQEKTERLQWLDRLSLACPPRRRPEFRPKTAQEVSRRAAK